jgi:hypothetical protein
MRATSSRSAADMFAVRRASITPALYQEFEEGPTGTKRERERERERGGVTQEQGER